jgi:hypothetical protein
VAFAGVAEVRGFVLGGIGRKESRCTGMLAAYGGGV